jgi:carbon storage regulator
MLVLSRRIGEEIVIGENVRVKVVAARGNKVRLAVCAPKTVRVDRLEINQRRAEFGNGVSDTHQGDPLVARCRSAPIPGNNLFARNEVQSTDR